MSDSQRYSEMTNSSELTTEDRAKAKKSTGFQQGTKFLIGEGATTYHVTDGELFFMGEVPKEQVPKKFGKSNKKVLLKLRSAVVTRSYIPDNLQDAVTGVRLGAFNSLIWKEMSMPYMDRGPCITNIVVEGAKQGNCYQMVQTTSGDWQVKCTENVPDDYGYQHNFAVQYVEPEGHLENYYLYDMNVETAVFVYETIVASTTVEVLVKSAAKTEKRSNVASTTLWVPTGSKEVLRRFYQKVYDANGGSYDFTIAADRAKVLTEVSQTKTFLGMTCDAETKTNGNNQQSGLVGHDYDIPPLFWGWAGLGMDVDVQTPLDVAILFSSLNMKLKLGTYAQKYTEVKTGTSMEETISRSVTPSQQISELVPIEGEKGILVGNILANGQQTGHNPIRDISLAWKEAGYVGSGQGFSTIGKLAAVIRKGGHVPTCPVICSNMKELELLLRGYTKLPMSELMINSQDNKPSVIMGIRNNISAKIGKLDEFVQSDDAVKLAAKLEKNTAIIKELSEELKRNRDAVKPETLALLAKAGNFVLSANPAYQAFNLRISLADGLEDAWSYTFMPDENFAISCGITIGKDAAFTSKPNNTHDKLTVGAFVGQVALA